MATHLDVLAMITEDLDSYWREAEICEGTEEVAESSVEDRVSDFYLYMQCVEKNELPAHIERVLRRAREFLSSHVSREELNERARRLGNWIDDEPRSDIPRTIPE